MSEAETKSTSKNISDNKTSETLNASLMSFEEFKHSQKKK